MKYAEYQLANESAKIDQAVYRAMLKEAASPYHPNRLKAILNIFIALHVPADYEWDVEEIKTEALADIAKGDYAEDMAIYAEMIWNLPASVSDAVFHTLEQLVETE